ncbi:RraA family protein [Actinokineospora auranticolor]|uniref:Putative 4-hydroxy-4-methyl-2-oxoglutarate aldolase n=1 Tax=Actinokineospora auranticolor TaxID=155976 RepID=A0A2S6GHX9_9PSEU|nr:RraA family protein [Actinokineospora auranticolor]PPK64838.1 regulator of RNase E activity RraA [Actinokineospora auranticolor]
MTDCAALFAEHGTSAVSDALDRLGVDGGLPGLAARSSARRVAGPAFTVHLEPVAPGTPAPAADYIDDVPAGAVVVLANAGRDHCTVWGDILTEVALRHGVLGTVIDGVCRDLDAIRALDYPLWSLGSYMKSGKNRVRMVAAQVEVTVRGTAVAPGDLVVADASGVLVVPSGLLDDTVRELRDVLLVEQAVRDAAAAGVPLRAARREHGYNRPPLSGARP